MEAPKCKILTGGIWRNDCLESGFSAGSTSMIGKSDWTESLVRRSITDDFLFRKTACSPLHPLNFYKFLFIKNPGFKCGGMRRKSAIKISRKVRMSNAAKSSPESSGLNRPGGGIRRKSRKAGPGQFKESTQTDDTPNILCLKT